MTSLQSRFLSKSIKFVKRYHQRFLESYRTTTKLSFSIAWYYHVLLHYWSVCAPEIPCLHVQKKQGLDISQKSLLFWVWNERKNVRKYKTRPVLISERNQVLKIPYVPSSITERMTMIQESERCQWMKIRRWYAKREYERKRRTFQNSFCVWAVERRNSSWFPVNSKGWKKAPYGWIAARV